ncbi:uncharacterized protein LOC122934712 isoform X1 [Bufo gargarizans]|uniref:uncharacterized protein LOC122934712 isoform X1 n=2 Tax=Bufo gargarizans TaxID=30331 RepID=UPI001CF1DF08|nr:uncharacterized protein LOC122934712 isoform X1 [Bufo gargarizans]
MSQESRKMQFSEWKTGKRRLRYLYICPPCSFQLHHGQKAEDNMIPVFLGSDVVSQTGIRTENHPKIHAKFARKGLAARLNFSSEFKFEKLRLPGGMNSLWFYSIQGLFKVAFDLYSREEQMAVIESLQELWKSRLKDKPLDKFYNLSICLESNKRVIPQAEEPQMYEKLSVSSSQQISGIPRVPLSLSEHNYCMTSQDGSSGCLSHDTAGHDLIIQKLKYLVGLCSSSLIDLENQLLKTTVALLDVVGQVFSGHNYLDKIINSIMDLLEAVSHVQDKDNPKKEASNMYENQLLFEVSSWLGNRFHSENDRISQQVEAFKRKHIDRISDLPPAEELVAALFPNAMKVLLLKWMGLFDDASVSKLQSEYPILLLILEFANHNLITGVSHVLYSSLICK